MIDTYLMYSPIASTLWIAPYRTRPNRSRAIGRVLSFYQKPAHIRHRCIGSTFQGENIIKTHLISFAWFARAFACVVDITAQTKALGDIVNAYRTHWEGNHAGA
jgi:hypothetical protein